MEKGMAVFHLMHPVERVDSGTELVYQAGATMGEVIASVQRASETIAEITEVSEEQTAGVERQGTCRQVNRRA
jgi:methyl-accepting chemotaxis protein